jgi:hypothetical protein
MKTLASTFGLALLGSLFLVGPTSCAIQSCKDGETKQGGNCVQLSTLETYNGTPSTQTVAYAAGKNMAITSVNGAVSVVPGSAGTVTVTFKPADVRASGEAAQATAEMQNNLTMSASADANGNVIITTSRNGGSTGLGAKIEVAIPPEFAGALKIQQGNGAINVGTVAAASSLEVQNTGAGGVTVTCGSAFAGQVRVLNQAGDVGVGGVGSATLVEIQNSGTGDCTLVGSPTVTTSTVHCGWDISVSNVSDHVDIVSTNTLNATVAVALASVSAGTSGGSVTLTSGQVNMTMPAAANYTLQATASSGQVNLGAAPATCVQSPQNSATAKSMTCGTGGPNYVIAAGDASNTGNVTLAYQ